MSHASEMNMNQDLDNTELNTLLTRKQPKVIPSAPKCSKCQKSVYAAEEIRGANQIFHKLCFKCSSCNKLLQPSLITEHAGELYCKSCYGRQFGPKGYGFGGGGAGTLSMDSNGGMNTHSLIKSNSTENETSTISTDASNQMISSMSCSSISSMNSNNSLTSSRLERKTILPLTSLNSNNLCARCNKAVYAAEKVAAAGHHYHKLCFSCSNCKKLLNSMNCCDNSDGQVFCKACYGKLYGPKGIGYGIGAGTLKTN